MALKIYPNNFFKLRGVLCGAYTKKFDSHYGAFQNKQIAVLQLNSRDFQETVP